MPYFVMENSFLKPMENSPMRKEVSKHWEAPLRDASQMHWWGVAKILELVRSLEIFLTLIPSIDYTCWSNRYIASELWDPNFILEWKKRNVLAVTCENAKTKTNKVLYRRKDRPAFSYPWTEKSAK